ncbi:hypothetical protein ACFL6S_25595 [Candidatus Poribacteria bacterium]
MAEYLLITMITVFMLTASPHLEDNIMCRIVSVPEVAFNRAPMTVEIEYSLSKEIISAQLHVELKGLSHDVYTSQIREVKGTGRKSFEFECPVPHDESMIVAAWMGDDWQAPLYPIQFSHPIPVFPHDAYQQKLAADNASQEAVRQRLDSLDYMRSPGKNVAILSIDIQEIDQQVIDHYTQALSIAGFETTELSLDEPMDLVVLNPEHFDFLMLTDIRLFPSSYMFSLMRYLQDGGKLIAFGAPAFQEQVWRSGDRWVTEALYLETLAEVEPAQVLFDFEDSDLAGWRRAAQNSGTPTDHSILSEGRDGGRCLRVGIDKLDGWDTYSRMLDTRYSELVSENALTIFWAKGDGNTNHLIVELQESDMSRWIATIRLESEWRKYVLTPSDFEYWRDNPSKGRGGTGDDLHPENAQQISFGVAQGFAPYRNGASYTYWIDDIGFAPNLETSPPSSYRLQLPIISPAYKIYKLGEVSKLWHTAPYMQDGKSTEVSIKDAWFPVPRHHGSGFNRDRKKRFIRLLDARHDDGTYRGSVCTMLINMVEPWFPSAWITVGSAERNALTSEAITETIIGAARRLSQGVFLTEAGAEHYSYYPGEAMKVGARLLNISHNAQTAMVRIMLHDQSGPESLIVERELDIETDSGVALEEEIKTPDVPDSEWFIRTELISDGQTIDFIQQRFSILAEPIKDKTEFVTISGGDFYLNGEKWYPYGINYWPCYVAGGEPSERFSWWYNPELVERDLDQMEAMGMNMVSIQSTTLDNSRDFLDFLARIYKRGIRVNLFLHGSDPLRFDEDLVTKQIKGWKLDTNPAVFAYDLAWEHKLGKYGARKRWDGEWSDWIHERYGSLKSAEDDWEFAVPRSEGKITGPSDNQLTNDGPWRVMVAAYRRFVDDFVSRKYRQAVKTVKEMAPNQLISVRMGYGGTGPCHPSLLPVDLRSVAKHLEFLSPEGWGMNGTREQVLSGGFTTAYSDWASRGKPCFWCEWGMNIWDRSTMRPDPERIEEQGRQYEYFSEMFLLSGANGQAAWWWPGGFRVGENSDFGILSPDASWRPACYALKEWAPKLKASRERPKPDRWITIDRDSHPGGYWHVYNTHKDEYAQALLDGHLTGVKTEGTDTTSKNTPLLAVGNTDYNGSNPPKHLNAEFNRLEIRNAQGQWVAISDGDVIRVNQNESLFVRASVGNTGEAEWLAGNADQEKGAVYLSSRTEKGFRFAPIPADTPYMGDATVAPFALIDSVQKRIAVEFEMTAYDRAWFGEKISVMLEP